MKYNAQNAASANPPLSRPGLRSLAIEFDRAWLQWLPLAGVVALSFALNAWGASKSGYGNTYYAAAVRSMTVSWKNFFFGAFDPGGFITVDKPPAFLWVDALSARIFGYSTWSLMLPSAFAGAASVALLWLIIRRYFGSAAATIAAAVLALTPISVAVNRLNLPEPFMILVLVAAAGAVTRSFDSRRWWLWLVVAGTLVGFAFNIKMLAAWIPGPAFALAVVAATGSVSWNAVRQLFARLTVLGVTTLVVSASWLLIVDAWPASSRPYIGGSTDNTVLDLALGYNGFSRVEGNTQFGGGAPPPGAPANGQSAQPPRTNGRGFAPPAGRGTFGGGARGAAPGAGFNGAGGIIAGAPGILRLFDDANGGQISWLLPFALGVILVAVWRWRRDPARRAVVILFAGWIVLFGEVFSYAQGIFHSYYTSAMAPGIAAMVGIGAVSLADAVKRDIRWLAAGIALFAMTAWVQLDVAGRVPDFYGWLRPISIAALVAAVLAVIALTALRRRDVLAGVVVAIAALLVTPTVWSVSVSATPSLNSTLPQAGPQQGASGRTFGSAAFDNGTTQLAVWLEAHNDRSATWQIAVTSAQNASSLIAEYNISVMAIGGFSGGDNSISAAQFATLVDSGAVRYVLTSSGGPGAGFAAPAGGAARNRARGGGGSSAGAIMTSVEGSCAAVGDASVPAQYQGALYDCSGSGAALRAHAS